MNPSLIHDARLITPEMLMQEAEDGSQFVLVPVWRFLSDWPGAKQAKGESFKSELRGNCEP
jgi:hypothetical protein